MSQCLLTVPVLHVEMGGGAVIGVVSQCPFNVRLLCLCTQVLTKLGGFY